MMFSELASIRVDGAKQAALLLHSLAPDDRAWVLAKLDADQHSELLPLIAELDSMGLSSPLTALNREALARGVDDGGGLSALDRPSVAGSAVSEEKAALTDTEFLKALESEDVASLARVWSLEQPELVAYALKIQTWPWQGALLERLPVAQRGRVQDAFESMSNLSGESKLAIAVMSRMRKCCEVSGRNVAPTSHDSTSSASGKGGGIAAQPLQSLIRGWQRWTAGLRREVP